MRKIMLMSCLALAPMLALSIGDDDESTGGGGVEPATEPSDSPAEPVQGDAAPPQEELESNEDDTLGDVQEQGVEDTDPDVADADGDETLPA